MFWIQEIGATSPEDTTNKNSLNGKFIWSIWSKQVHFLNWLNKNADLGHFFSIWYTIVQIGLSLFQILLKDCAMPILIKTKIECFSFFF